MRRVKDALNRRSALKAGHAAWTAMRRESTPLSVMMLDVDYFKRVNDTHGHAGGDEALRQVAQVMRQCLRRSDHVARWGGEEFLVILPGAAQDEALALAERLRIAVASNTFRAQETAMDLTVTVSIGLSSVSEADATLEEVIARADRASYRAKHEGRNRSWKHHTCSRIESCATPNE